MAFITVTVAQVKKCDKCGAPIAFHRNRNNKAYPVSVVSLPTGEMAYESGIGAYGNFTPWHKCQQDKQQAQAINDQRARNDIAAKYTQRMHDAMIAGDMATFESLTAEYRKELEAL